MFQSIKKYVIPISFITGLLLVVALYFALFRSTNVYEAIPDSAVAVVEISDWDKFSAELNNKPGAAELNKTAPIKKLVTQVTFVQQFITLLKPELKAKIHNTPLTLSVHLISADDFDYLFTLPANNISIEDIDKCLRLQMAGSAVASAYARIFKQQKVEDVTMKNGTKFCITCVKGILVLSYTSFLTENSVNAIANGNNLDNDKDLCKVIKRNNGNDGLKVFINFKKADVIFPVAIKLQKTGLLADMHGFQSWAGYSIRFEANNVIFSGQGLLLSNDKHDTQIKNILSNTIWNNIPDNAAYVNAGFTDFKSASKNTSDNGPARAAFADWAGDARAFITLEPLTEDFTGQNVFIVAAKDEAKATTALKKLITTEGNKAVATDTFMHTEIFNLKGGSIINQALGSSFTLFGNTFFAVSNQAAVFCNNEDILKFVLEKIKKGETLNKDASLRQAVEASGNTATGVIYFNPAKATMLLSGIIKDGSGLQTYLAHQSTMLLELNTGDTWNTTRGVWITGAASKGSPGLLWKTKLQTLSVYKPQIVINETNGEKEIFTQDTANNIYLLNKSGEVIFTKNIGEKIIGNVQQLDYYSNGQLQYIFNTTSHVFMLDRNGNDAASYPLRLSNTASCGLTLVRSGPAAYRYYVPCSNGAVYGYEANGRPLTGWSPKTGLGLITKPVQGLKIKKNECILAFNNAGKLLLMGGKGEVKWSVDNLPVTPQQFSVVELNNDFAILNAAGNQLIEISPDGNDNIKPLIDSAFSFAATTMSDSCYQYFYSGLHNVRSYTGTGEFKNAISVKNDLLAGLEIVTISGTKYLLVKDSSAAKVLIYDLALNPVGGYPVLSMEQFTITDLLGTNEFTGIQPDADGNIECYRIK